MVDFAVHGGPLINLGVKVAAASVDSIESVAALKAGLHVGYPMYAEIDHHKIAADTGAHKQTSGREIMHATGFLLEPDGTINTAVYSTGPIGRFTASEIIRKVTFEQAQRS